MAKVLVDTNLLVYSVNPAERKKHAKAVAAVVELIKRQDFCVSAQNLAEFCRVVGEKSQPAQSPDDIRQWVRSFRRCGEVLHYTGGSVHSAWAISKADGIHFFDALLVATMHEHGVDEIWTENVKDFKKVRGLKVRNPLKRIRAQRAIVGNRPPLETRSRHLN